MPIYSSFVEQEIKNLQSQTQCDFIKYFGTRHLSNFNRCLANQIREIYNNFSTWYFRIDDVGELRHQIYLSTSDNDLGQQETLNKYVYYTIVKYFGGSCAQPNKKLIVSYFKSIEISELINRRLVGYLNWIKYSIKQDFTKKYNYVNGIDRWHEIASSNLCGTTATNDITTFKNKIVATCFELLIPCLTSEHSQAKVYTENGIVYLMFKINSFIEQNNKGHTGKSTMEQFLANVAQETPLPSRGGMNCDNFYRMHMAR